MELRILTANDLRQALPMEQAVEAMKSAYAQLSSGEADVPLRSRIESPDVQGVTLLMPALLHRSGEMAVKIVSVFGRNPEFDLDTIHALVIVLDSKTGAPLAILEGGSLTAIRTGAGSGAATDLLARSDAKTVAIIGSGAQARTQLEAVCTVRAIEQAWVHSLDRPQAMAMIADLRSQGPIPEDLAWALSADQAVAGADIVCAATTSSAPVFDGKAVRPGTHINAIGSFTPQMQEIDAHLVKSALVVVDSREAVLAESGDLLIPLQAGIIDRSVVHAELGEVVSGDKPGRIHSEQITLFKSVGVAAQDAAAAGLALARASQSGLGRVVQL